MKYQTKKEDPKLILKYRYKDKNTDLTTITKLDTTPGFITIDAMGFGMDVVYFKPLLILIHSMIVLKYMIN